MNFETYNFDNSTFKFNFPHKYNNDYTKILIIKLLNFDFQQTNKLNVIHKY